MKTKKTLCLFALAAALGALSRLYISQYIGCISSFSLGIFAVNIFGCFAFGSVWALATLYQCIHERTKFIILTGFLGSFTTFATFIFDIYEYINTYQWFLLIVYTVGHIILGLGAIRLGIYCVSRSYVLRK